MVENSANGFRIFFLTEKGKTKENKGLKYPLGCTVRITVRKMKGFFEQGSCDVNPESSEEQLQFVLSHKHSKPYRIYMD